MSGHVVTLMYEAAGCPQINWTGKARSTRVAPTPRDGVCALTGQAGEVFDARHVVSELWTSWDGLRFRHADPAGLAFSPAASWALRHRPAAP